MQECRLGVCRFMSDSVSGDKFERHGLDSGGSCVDCGRSIGYGLFCKPCMNPDLMECGRCGDVHYRGSVICND